MTPQERKADVARRFWSHMRAAAEALERRDRECIVLEWNVLVGMLDLELKGDAQKQRLARGMVAQLSNVKRELERVERKAAPAPATKRKRGAR